MAEILPPVRHKVIVDEDTKGLLPLLDLGGGRALPAAPEPQEVR